MAYITVEYYKTTFLGTDPGSDSEISRAINRASDIIDLLTGNQVYDDMDADQQAAMQKATAYQTENLIVNGDTFNEMDNGAEKIGQWSRGGGTGSPRVISGMARDILGHVGLLFSGMDLAGEDYLETDIL